MTAPTIEAARKMGADGSPPVEAERLAFEAWMHGHCWALGATWTGKGYRSDAEVGGRVDPHAMHTRGMWAAWRDRAALAAQSAPSGAGAPVAADKIVDEYADEYAFDDCGNAYIPTKQEGALLVDFGHGLVAQLQEAGLLSTGVPAAAPSGAGAELVREVEAAAKRALPPNWATATEDSAALNLVSSPWWDRIRTAILSGSRSGEDARDAALDLLETMYRLWENGTDCYEDPEDCTGYLGKAVDLDDPTEHKIIDLLNEHRPTKSPFDAAMGGNDA